MAFAQTFPEDYANCYPKAIERLKRVSFTIDISILDYQPLTLFFSQILIERDYSLDYIYYKVPTPWLQVKCLRLLQYYPPPGTSMLHIANFDMKMYTKVSFANLDYRGRSYAR
jgi:AP-2 complex subunit alpha